MTKAEPKWNLTLNRFRSIVSKSIPENHREEFERLIGHSVGRVEYVLSEMFDRRTWLTKKDKVETLTIMTKIFLYYREHDESKYTVYTLFAKGLALRFPGTFDLWLRAPKSIQNSPRLYKYQYSRNSRTYYTYLNLLEVTGFNEEYVAREHEDTMAYLDRVRGVNNLTSAKLDFSIFSPYLNKVIREAKGLDGFERLTPPLFVLIRSIYGTNTFEEALRTFVEAGFHIYPKDLMKVLDRWDELSQYPAHWIVEVLNIDNAAILT